MDQRIEQYIEGLVRVCLSQPQFANLLEPQRNQVADQVRKRLYKVITDSVIDKLNDEQLSVLEALDPSSIEMEKKIQEFASQMPGLAQELDQKLKAEVENIKQNQQLSV